ncbi:MAG: aminodeoxychorismate synthase component I [Gammaproteobacteria bacterium]|nr:aminodeoxychorismate synthase component I [Gammaproteobacteria bacterium]
MVRSPASSLRLPHPVDLLEFHIEAPDRYPCLLQSRGGASGTGRYDILFAFPGEALTLAADGQLSGPGAVVEDRDFLAALDRWWRETGPLPAGLPDLPFTGGWFIVLGYELASQIEPSVPMTTDPAFPVASAVRVPAALIHDHGTGSVTAVAEADQAPLLDVIAGDALRARRRQRTGRPGGPATAAGVIVEEDPQRFLHAVRLARGHIARGDVYQVNLSRQWHGPAVPGMPAWRVFERLQRTNPAPFAGLVRFGSGWLVSSSPERLVEVRGQRVETRPIAGTRPRSPTGAEDRQHRAELIASDKERAEHVMLIDLERNDLGRICQPGTVRVEDLMTVESYAHVHHIVSTVSGTLRSDASPGAVLRAVFPGGTITGCPKVRGMGIIRELEDRPRGPYTGSMGYLNRDGSCDFNILIRTLTLDEGGWRLSAGSGIVADSTPERELEETRAKAKGMLLALQDGPD